jgi:hypothetical protein
LLVDAVRMGGRFFLTGPDFAREGKAFKSTVAFRRRRGTTQMIVNIHAASPAHPKS